MKKFAISRPNVPGKEEFTPICIGFSDEPTVDDQPQLGEMTSSQIEGLVDDINHGLCSGRLPELEAGHVLGRLAKHLVNRLKGHTCPYSTLYVEWHTPIDKSDANALRMAAKSLLER